MPGEWVVIGICVVCVCWVGIQALAYWMPERLGALKFFLPPSARAHIAYCVGEADEALRQLEGQPALLRWSHESYLLTALGAYHRTLSVRPYAPFTRRARRTGGMYAVIVVNQAEALYNLGHWRRAERLMNALFASGQIQTPYTSVAGACQLAWIYAHTGRGGAAEFVLEGLNAAALPRPYRAEFFFTRTAIALSLARPEQALHFLHAGRTLAVRASSVRNGLFLEARVLSAMGKHGEAEQACAKAAALPYRGQGGDGLLLWGDLLARRGDRPGSQTAWQLAIERDPESESASIARLRLAAVRP